MSIPSTSQRLLDEKGNIDAHWRRWLETLGTPVSLDDLEAQVAAIQDDLDAIGSPVRIVGQYSVSAPGSDGTYYLHLLNDQQEPGETYYYGTGPTGLKGWFAVADAFVAGSYIELDTDPDTGVTTINSTATGAVPYFIAEGATYSVPEYIQALFSMPIDCEGYIAADGYLIGVD